AKNHEKLNKTFRRQSFFQQPCFQKSSQRKREREDVV
ncbi:hypothetical protein YPPY66_1006, partial [Yersinia pestis PY-66]